MRMEEGLKRVCRQFGFAVVGIPASCDMPITVADCFGEWAGAQLPDGVLLMVTERATRTQWDAQHQFLFGNVPDKNPHTRGARYFRCVPVDATGNVIEKYKRLGVVA